MKQVAIVWFMILVCIGLFLAATLVQAACRTSTVTLPDGRFMICQTCCDSSGNCQTTCF